MKRQSTTAPQTHLLWLCGLLLTIASLFSSLTHSVYLLGNGTTTLPEPAFLADEHEPGFG